MIVATGTKRSGTSMWMQLLKAAGFPPIGEWWSDPSGRERGDAGLGGTKALAGGAATQPRARGEEMIARRY